METTKSQSGIVFRKIWKPVVGVLILAGLFSFYVPKMNWEEVFSSIRKAEAQSLFFALVFVVVYWAIRASLLWAILNSRAAVAWNLSFRVTLVGMMVDQLIPGRVGMLARWAILSSRVSVAKSFVAFALLGMVVIEALGLIGFALPSVFLNLKLFSDSASDISLNVFGIILLGVFGVLLFLYGFPQLDSIVSRQSKWAGSGVFQSFREFIFLLRRPRNLIPWLSLGLGNWICQAVIVYFCATAFSISLSLSEIAFLLIAINLAILIPVVPANIGSIQLAILFVLERLGVDPSLGLAFGVGYHACHLIPVLMGGSIGWLTTGIRFGELVSRPNLEKTRRTQN